MVYRSTIELDVKLKRPFNIKDALKHVPLYVRDEVRAELERFNENLEPAERHAKWDADPWWAPAVLREFCEPGSEIRFIGEDGMVWGYRLKKNGDVVDLRGQIVWGKIIVWEEVEK